MTHGKRRFRNLTHYRKKSSATARRPAQNKPSRRRLPKLNKRHRLNPHNIKALSAPHILAPHRVVPPNHIALCLGKTSPVAVIGPSRQLRLLPPHNPINLILALLSAVRTRHHVRPLLRLLIKKVPLFHTHLTWPAAPTSSRRPSAILPELPPLRQESCIISRSSKS